jgi:outer membrane protein, multidrug efflux system
MRATKRSTLPALAVYFLSLLLTACMVGPDYQRPELTAPEDWHADLKYKSIAEPSLADLAWVDLFQDELLRNVVQQALEQNKELLIAIERIEEARAFHRISRSTLFPSLDLQLSGEREGESDLTNDNASRSDEFFFGPSARWELDLWGKNRRGNNAAYAQYLATEYGAQAVRLSLIGDVCQTYFQLQGLNGRLEINYSTLGSRKQAVVIAEKRFRGGLTSSLEVKQAEVEFASTRASVPLVEQDKLEAENRLAVLMGLPPQHLTLESSLEDQFIPASVLAGLPSTLLERRPDIMQAEQNLIAASESIGVAKARLFPNISLTGSAGYETAEFSDLLDSDGKFWILNIDIVMPLFNAGARRAELTAAESRFNQARLRYEQRVIDSLREVSNALNQFYKAGESLEAQLALQKASEEYLSLATKRYRNGVLSYLDVLDAQRRLFDAQLDASSSRQAQLFALVDLYKSLGGGWDPAAVPSPEGEG